jgi:hypothetical protein
MNREQGLEIVNENKVLFSVLNSLLQNYKPVSSRAVNFSSNTCNFYSGVLLKFRGCPGEQIPGGEMTILFLKAF